MRSISTGCRAIEPVDGLTNPEPIDRKQSSRFLLLVSRFRFLSIILHHFPFPFPFLILFRSSSRFRILLLFIS